MTSYAQVSGQYVEIYGPTAVHQSQLKYNNHTSKGVLNTGHKRYLYWYIHTVHPAMENVV